MGDAAESDVPMGESDLLSRVVYRVATPTDMLACVQLEKTSYLKEEAASKNDLQYRQHHAAPYFRCAVLESEDEEDDEDEIVGYICSTRCDLDEKTDSISNTHQPKASTLIVHSVVVKEGYLRKGIGTDMVKNYVDTLRSNNLALETQISKVALFAKEHLLTFFIRCGFSAVRPSAITQQGTDQKYYLELSLQASNGREDSTFGNFASSIGRECYIVDSFAASAGTGNPAAVVTLPPDTDPDSASRWMQTVAAEFNLAETAFIWPGTQAETSSDEVHWNIRYYTPKMEIPLCGHATLASAAILYMTMPSSEDSRIVFRASEDTLTMALEKPTDDMQQSLRISMEFPAKPARELKTREDQSAVRIMLKSAFSCDLEPLYIGVSDIGDVLIELTPPAFRDIGYEHLNFKALLEWDGYYRGVIICCENSDPQDREKEASSPDFLSRFFGPKAGINEDPVTGSAHCVLGPYFSQKLKKDKVTGKQASERGGLVECWVSEQTVRLTGSAIPTLHGTLWM